MNPLAPDPLALLKDITKATDGRRPGGVKDNFKIIDGTAKPNWGSTSDYEAAIGKNFQFTDRNFQEALDKSVREGKPLVVIFGSKDTRDTRGLVEGVVPKAKGASDAIFVYADRSRLDPNSELGRFAKGELNNSNWAYTGVFAPKTASDGRAHLESPVANFWGARDEIGSSVTRQAGSAKAIMRGRGGTYEPDREIDRKPSPEERRPDALETEKKERAADANLKPAMDKIFANIADLKDTDFDGRERIYKEAEAAADKINPEDLKLARQKTARELAAEMNKSNGKDQQKIDELKIKDAKLGLLETAGSWVRINHGLSLMRFSQLDEGAKKIQEGLSKNPEFLNHPKFLEQLVKSPYEIDLLKEKFPGAKIDEFLAGKLTQQPQTKTDNGLRSEPGSKPESRIEPAGKSEIEPEPSKTRIEQPTKLKFDGSEFQTALEEAERSGRRLVVKVGTKGCSGCDIMTKNSWPDSEVQENLKKNAIFVDLDGLKQTDLAVEQLKADSWPTTLVLETYRENGQLKAREVDRLQWPDQGEITTANLKDFLSKNLKTPTAQEAVRPRENKDASDNQAQNQHKGLSDEVFTRLESQHKANIAPLAALGSGSTAADIEKAYDQAIKNASNCDKGDLQKAMAILRSLAEPIVEGRNSGELSEVEARNRMKPVLERLGKIKEIERAEGYLYVSRGALKLEAGGGFKDAGIADVKTGLEKHPKIAEDPQLIARLLKTGYELPQLKGWFPSIPFDSQRQEDKKKAG